MSAIVLDVETTGFNPHEDRIIEIAILDFDTGSELLYTRLNPDKPISEQISNLTGITDADVTSAPRFSDIAESVIEIVANSDAIIGYATHFDRGMIAAEIRRCEKIIKFPVAICAKRVWDIYEPREKRDLINAFKRFVSKDGFNGAHGALADTLATWKVIHAQMDEFSLRHRSWAEIDPEMSQWWGPSNHVVWKDEILVVNFGKHRGTPAHQVDRKYYRWISEQNDFPSHILVLCDYLTVVAGPNITAKELAFWARNREI